MFFLIFFASCQVYDSLESDIKLNDVFEFVGVLASDMEPHVDNEDYDFTNEFCEDPLRHFPPNKVFIMIYIGEITNPYYISWNCLWVFALVLDANGVGA